MKLTCDLCGGALQRKPGGAVCENCGLEYGPDRLQEKMAQQKPADTKPIRKDPPVPKKPTAAELKVQKKMKIMWIILALIGVVAFIGGLMESGMVYVVCLAALLITLFIFKPWKVYGGDVI